MKVWLFCNEGYGLPYLKAFLRYCKTNNVKYQVVFSTKKYADSTNISIKNSIKNIIVESFKKITFYIKYKTYISVIEDVNEYNFYKKISSQDCAIVAGFNQIFKKQILEQFNLIINYHPSILPYYRGPVPSYWCIKYGEIMSGYSLHLMTENIDSGKVLFQEIVKIEGIYDEHMVDIAIANKGAKNMIKLLDSWLYQRNFQNCIIDAEKVYKQHIEYQSFPEKE